MEQPEVTIDGPNYYVYALIDPLTYRQTGSQVQSILYVGKGTKNRALQHEKDELKALEKAANSIPMAGSKAERIRTILSSGERVLSIMLATGFNTENDAYRAESMAMELVDRLLRAYGREALGNLTPGHMQRQGMETGIAPEHGAASGQVFSDPARPAPSPGKESGDPFAFTPVAQALLASTAVRVDWREALASKVILVKGTAEEMVGGSHASIDDQGTLGSPYNVVWKDSNFLRGHEFTRPGFDPDDPWDDQLARERGARYWPLGKRTVTGWLDEPSTMPEHLLLAIPGNGGTTVRYAWRIDTEQPFEYYPEMDRWGVPLGDRDLAHPALGKTLTEARPGRERPVQVLANYVSGCRVLDPIA